MAKIKEKGMLNLKGMNKMVKKIKEKQPKGKQALQILPQRATGINPIEGMYYKK